MKKNYFTTLCQLDKLIKYFSWNITLFYTRLTYNQNSLSKFIIFLLFQPEYSLIATQNINNPIFRASSTCKMEQIV